ncbi:MAG TPA: hypothetical protein VD997_14205 [Phycisphaerales bacterium]|nr:hypothetical protein [Phycisphaerales bacterium]
MNDNPHLNDRELLALASEIDRLAFEDRGDAGLESRVFAASLPVLQNASRPPLRLVGTETVTTTVTYTRSRRTALRIAAGFAIAATAALTWLGTHRASPTAPAGTELMAAAPSAPSVDDWTIASVVFDDDFGDELDLLSNKASDLRSEFETIGTGESYEEAM